MSAYNFSQPQRQSKKGIIVIFALNIFKTLKQLFIVISLVLFQYLRNDDNGNRSFYWIFGTITVLIYLIINACLKYKNFKFQVTDSHFILQEGILNKEETSISIRKIQNVYIKQNLIQQFINVVSLSIETAGDDKTEIEINALSKSKADALKTLLLADKTEEIAKDKILENLDIRANYKEQSYFYKASLKKIILEGLSENHLRSLLVIFAFVGGLYNDFKIYLDGIYDSYNLDATLKEASITNFILINVILLIFVFVIGILFSCVKTLIENYNLKVQETANGLEISKGLINKINLGLQQSRIQNTTIKTNPLKQSLNLYKLSFTQALISKRQQKFFTIIGLGKNQIKELIIKFYPEVFEIQQKHKPEFYFILKKIYVSIIIIAALNLFFYVMPTFFYWFNFPLVIGLGFNVYYSYNKAYFSFNETYLTVGSGQLIDTTTSFLELHKIQSVNLQQSIFQKRKGLASLIIYTAAKPLKILHIKEEEAKKLLNFFIYKVETSPKNWM